MCEMEQIKVVFLLGYPQKSFDGRSLQVKPEIEKSKLNLKLVQSFVFSSTQS